MTNLRRLPVERCYRCCLVLFGVLLSVQGSSSAKGNGGERDLLPLGDINVVVVTDVHSWVHSHVEKEPYYNADYGAVLSFHHYLLKRIQKHKNNDKALLFVMNGDFMDGTGLTTHPPYPLVRILNHMPFDAINVGNHELYKDSTIDAIVHPKDGIIANFQDAYLTSNVEKESGPPLGSRYKLIETTAATSGNNNITVLAFGFIYNFQGGCDRVRVKPVEQELEAPWFRMALEFNQYDAILVLCHMDVENPLVYKILKAIRYVVGDDFPVQFITGHTHYRGYKELDKYAASFEAGRFLDTVGFVSFPTNKTIHDTIRQEKHDTHDGPTTSASVQDKNRASPLFQHIFLDASVQKLREAVGVKFSFRFFTNKAYQLQALIRTTREELGLTRVIGCTNTSLFLDRGLDEPASLWGFFRDQLIKSYFFQNDESKLYFQSSGAFRYNLLKGTITLDDILSVATYNDTIYKVAGGLTGAEIIEVLGHYPNTDIDPHAKSLASRNLPGTVVSQDHVDESSKYDLYTPEFEKKKWSDKVTNVTGKTYPIEPQDMAVTLLWQKYVEEHMNHNCPKRRPPTRTYQEMNENAHGMGPVIVITVSIVVLICGLLTLVLIVRRVARYVGYSKTNVYETTIEFVSRDDDEEKDDDDDDKKKKAELELI